MGGCNDRGACAGGDDKPPPWNGPGARALGRRRDGRLDARLASGEGRNRSAGDAQPARDGRLVIGGRPGAPILFIVNPTSAAGRAGKEWSGINDWLATTGLPYEARLTTRQHEATEMAQAAVRESRPVVVAV